MRAKSKPVPPPDRASRNAYIAMLKQFGATPAQLRRLTSRLRPLPAEERDDRAG